MFNKKLWSSLFLSVLLCSACADTIPSTCGNGVLDPGESCDGTNLGAKTCQLVDPTLTGTTLACSPTCTFDTSNCSPYTPPETCGNNTVEGNEECDGTNLNGQNCVTLVPGASGLLSCVACRFDRTQCQVEQGGTCGDGSVDPGEQCDKANLNGKTCKDINPALTSGSLACNNNCTFNTSDCKPQTPSTKCGNGKVEVGEQCDTKELTNCRHIDGAYVSGYAACTQCNYDLSECKYPSGSTKEISWCKIVEPLVVTFDDQTSSATVKGQVIIPTITDKTTGLDADSTVKAQIVYGTDFKSIANWSTINGTGDTTFTNASIDQYTAVLQKTSFVDVKTAYFLWRFSDDNGNSWKYCKRDTEQHLVTEYDFHGIDPQEHEGFLPNAYNSGKVEILENSSAILHRWDFNQQNMNPITGAAQLAYTGVAGYIKYYSDGKAGYALSLTGFRYARENDPLKPSDTKGALDPSGARLRISNIAENSPLTLSVDVSRNHDNSPYYIAIGYSQDCTDYIYLPEAQDLKLDDDPEHIKQFYTYSIKLPVAAQCIELIPWGSNEGSRALRFDNLILQR